MTPNTASSIPQTLLRSAPQAQHLWKNAHDRAVKTYGDLSRAHRAAFTALKNEFQKDGDRWVPRPSSNKNGKKPAASMKAPIAPATPVKAKTVASKTARTAKAPAPAKTKEIRKASSSTTRRRQRKTNTNNKTVTRKRSVQRSKK